MRANPRELLSREGCGGTAADRRLPSGGVSGQPSRRSAADGFGKLPFAAMKNLADLPYRQTGLRRKEGMIDCGSWGLYWLCFVFLWLDFG